MKICTRCKIEKELSAYSKNKAMIDGLCIVCKSCQKLSYDADKQKKYNKAHKERNPNYDKEYREKNKDILAEKDKQYKEANKERLKQKDREYYERNKERKIESSKEYYKENKEKMKDYQREYQKEYREKNKEYQKEYREKNKEKLRSNRKYYKTKYDPVKAKENYEKDIEKSRERERLKKQKQRTNPLYKLRSNISSLIWGALSNRGYTKRSKTHQILGCSFEEFYAHIESLFLEGMDWDNRSEWHLDHIVPLSFGENEEEILRLNHYSNLRPLWGKDNLEKSARLVEESLNHPIYSEIIKSREK